MKSPDPEDFVEQQDVGDFTSVLVNFYRGEVQRAYTWRTRLDRTTNWAILILSALITWTYSSANRPHELLLFSMLFIAILWGIEARRYVFYNVWDSRIRVLEANFIAKALNPNEEVTSREWMKTLAEDLKKPSFKIPFWTGLAHRLRRIYFWLFSITLILWIGKLAMHPISTSDLSTMVSRAYIGSIDGIIVFSVIFLFYVFLILLALVGPKFEERKSKIQSDREKREEWEEKM